MDIFGLAAGLGLQAGNWMTAGLDAAARWAFFKLIFDFIDDEIETFQNNLLSGMLDYVGGIALVSLTVWILFQGYRILSGQSREQVMGFTITSLKATLIIGAATTFAVGDTDLLRMLSDQLPREIHEIVTGEEEGPEDQIDRNLQIMEASMIAMDSLSTGMEETLKSAQERSMWFTGIGVAGPSVVGGAILLMYKFALALFVGLGPLFILSLLFEQTKSMFQRWLWYGVGTLFSLAVLSFTLSVAMKLIGAVAASFAAQYLVATGMGATPEGVSSLALQQGGVGLLMTILLVTVPPMAANFFQGAMGHFSSYSMFGATGSSSSANTPGAYRDPQGRPLTTSPQATPPLAPRPDGSPLERAPRAGTSVSMRERGETSS